MIEGNAPLRHICKSDSNWANQCPRRGNFQRSDGGDEESSLITEDIILLESEHNENKLTDLLSETSNSAILHLGEFRLKTSWKVV